MTALCHANTYQFLRPVKAAPQGCGRQPSCGKQRPRHMQTPHSPAVCVVMQLHHCSTVSLQRGIVITVSIDIPQHCQEGRKSHQQPEKRYLENNQSLFEIIHPWNNIGSSIRSVFLTLQPLRACTQVQMQMSAWNGARGQLLVVFIRHHPPFFLRWKKSETRQVD